MMDFNQTKLFLETKGQTQLLRYFDELDEVGKQKLLCAIEKTSERGLAVED